MHQDKMKYQYIDSKKPSMSSLMTLGQTESASQLLVKQRVVLSPHRSRQSSPKLRGHSSNNEGECSKKQRGDLKSDSKSIANSNHSRKQSKIKAK